jgi:hypothetical protein
MSTLSESGGSYGVLGAIQWKSAADAEPCLRVFQHAEPTDEAKRYLAISLSISDHGSHRAFSAGPFKSARASSIIFPPPGSVELSL